jgi:hypothetical protein
MIDPSKSIEARRKYDGIPIIIPATMGFRTTAAMIPV